MCDIYIYICTHTPIYMKQNQGFVTTADWLYYASSEMGSLPWSLELYHINQFSHKTWFSMSLGELMKVKFNSIQDFLSVTINILWDSQGILIPPNSVIFKMEAKQMGIAAFKGDCIGCAHPLVCRNLIFYFVYIYIVNSPFPEIF